MVSNLFTLSAIAVMNFGHVVYGQVSQDLLKAQYAGVTLVPELPSGACKSGADWAADFDAINSWPNPTGRKRAVRIYTTSGCNALLTMLQPALDHGIKIFATVSLDPKLYENDKQALVRLNEQGHFDVLAAVSVGSEDIYLANTEVQKLGNYIDEVRALLGSIGCSYMPITHVEVWPKTLMPNYQYIVDKIDFLATDGYPYYDGVAIENAAKSFKKNIDDVVGVAKGKPVWVGETGHPSEGDAHPDVATLANLDRYWHETVCNGGVLTERTFFWFAAFDNPLRTEKREESHFGLATIDRKPKFDQNCSC